MSVPQAHAPSQSFLYGAGKGLSGSSLINGTASRSLWKSGTKRKRAEVEASGPRIQTWPRRCGCRHCRGPARRGRSTWSHHTNYVMLYEAKVNGSGYLPYAVFAGWQKTCYGEDKVDEMAREAEAMDKIYGAQCDLIFNRSATMAEVLNSWEEDTVLAAY
jgi:hypothetical protein